MALFCTFADGTDSVSFDIVWRHNVNATTTISILDFAGESPLPDDTKNLEGVDTRQNVCMIHYSTNAGGIHTLAYRATSVRIELVAAAIFHIRHIRHDDIRPCLDA